MKRLLSTLAVSLFAVSLLAFGLTPAIGIADAASASLVQVAEDDNGTAAAQHDNGTAAAPDQEGVPSPGEMENSKPDQESSAPAEPKAGSTQASGEEKED